MSAIILIGFMGAGKTTIGKALAQALNCDHIDLDQAIEAKLGMSIAAYFEKEGEVAFRQVETQVLQELKESDAIISTGGGIVTQAANRALLQSLTPVIYLAAQPAVFAERIQADIANVRPLALSKTTAELVALYESRRAFYEESASHIIPTDQRTPAQIVAQITELLANEGA